MKTSLKKTPFSQQICCSYLRILLLRQAAGINLSETGFSQSIETYQRCKKYIDDNFTTISSPADVADSCAVNIRYIARLFRRFEKITPHNYIMRLKLNKAATLLLTSGLTVNKIGHSLGFNDPYHFSRVFKRFHGLAPHHYRQMHMVQVIRQNLFCLLAIYLYIKSRTHLAARIYVNFYLACRNYKSEEFFEADEKIK